MYVFVFSTTSEVLTKTGVHTVLVKYEILCKSSWQFLICKILNSRNSVSVESGVFRYDSASGWDPPDIFTALHSFKMLGTSHPITPYHIPEDLNPQFLHSFMQTSGQA